jgi:hypothetical protein
MADEIQDPSAMARALRWGKSQFSLDPQPDQDLISPETGGDLLLGSVPGVGQAMALRDMYRGYKADDPVAMGTAALGLVPFGKLGGVLKNKIIAGGRAAEAPIENMIKGRAELLKPKADADKVWQDLGVFRGYDKGTATGSPMKWEIPDTDARFVKDSLSWKRLAPDQMGDHQFQGKLGDLLEHPELFKNYPELRDMNVKALHGKGNPSSGRQLKNEIEASAENPKELMRTLLHEVQHRVQDIENFGLGGSPDKFSSKAVREALSNDPSLADTLFSPGSSMWKKIAKESMSKYKALPGEVESRSVERRFDMMPEELRKFSPLKTAKQLGYGPEKILVPPDWYHAP